MQMPVMKEVLDALNIPRYELAGWEADDLIGTISVRDTAEGWDTVIVTGDKDSLQLITDTTTWQENAKYSAFGTDYHMTHSYNADLLEGKNILVVKDSFGNCFVPYLTQNYQNVYAVDYRKLYAMPLTHFVEQYEIDDVLFMPYVTATQSIAGNNCIREVCF